MFTKTRIANKSHTALNGLMTDLTQDLHGPTHGIPDLSPEEGRFSFRETHSDLGHMRHLTNQGHLAQIQTQAWYIHVEIYPSTIQGDLKK